MVGIPYLDATSAYYKRVVNIYWYQIVLNYNLISIGKELSNIVKAIMPGYSLFKFIGVEESIFEDFLHFLCNRKID